MIKYVKYKTLDSWLEDDLFDILGYLVVKGKKVSVVKRKSQYKNPNKDSDAVVSKKIDFIENNILHTTTVERILHRYITETNTNWYDIPKHDYSIKRIVGKAIEKKLFKLMN